MNPLIDVPLSYGYYLRGVSTGSSAGVGVGTRHLAKWTCEAKLTNSSPTNPRSVLDSDQYLNWTVGGGYTIRRRSSVPGSPHIAAPIWIGSIHTSFRAKSIPRNLPATAVGIDVEPNGFRPLEHQWGVAAFSNGLHCHSGIHRERRLRQARYVLHPRWYLATRIGYASPSAIPGWRTYEAAVGYRAGKHQLIKLEYEVQQGPAISGTQHNTLAIQFVTTLHPISVAIH